MAINPYRLLCPSDRKIRRVYIHQPKNMDIIFLRALKIETVIGVFEWERQIKQTVVLD